MKNVGLALITLSFIGGAYISVLDAREVVWTNHLPLPSLPVPLA